MIPRVQMAADRPGTRTIQEGSYVDTTFTPHDGITYRVVTWIVRRSEGLAHFFAIARPGAPLTGTFVPLSQNLTLLAYVDLFGTSQDMDLELLWAGWRTLLYLTGQDDQVPPDDLPSWRPDWYVGLSASPKGLPES